MTSPVPIRFESNGPLDTGLQVWEAIDPDSLTAGEPVQRGHEYFRDDTGVLTAGVWDCTPMTGKLKPYDVSEFMHVLDGSITLDATHDDWSFTFNTGDSILKPKGTRYRWTCDGYVRKISCVFQPG